MFKTVKLLYSLTNHTVRENFTSKLSSSFRENLPVMDNQTDEEKAKIAAELATEVVTSLLHLLLLIVVIYLMLHITLVIIGLPYAFRCTKPGFFRFLHIMISICFPFLYVPYVYISDCKNQYSTLPNKNTSADQLGLKKNHKSKSHYRSHGRSMHRAKSMKKSRKY